MVADHEVILFFYALATGVGIALAAVVWRHRDTPGAVPLAVTMIGTALFSGPRFVATAVDSVAVSMAMERLLYVGVGLSVMAIVLFALEYTGREHLVTPTTVAALSIEPIAVVVLAFANPGGVFFESLEADPSMATGVAVEWGIAFGLHTLYSYLLMLAVTAMVLELLYTSRALYRGQAAALFGAVTLPWLANVVHVVGPIEADTTPFGYVVMGLLYAVAIVRYRFIDITPIARDRVLETVSEGIFVVDRDERLVDVNSAGRALLDAEGERSIVGRDVESVFATEPAVVDLFRELTATDGDAAGELALDGRYFELRTSPITNARDDVVGWLVLAYDITDRKRRAERLERQNERLERFADLVSHDLRNPLTVARGHLDLAHEAGDADDPDPHLDAVEESHERMASIIDDVLTLARDGDTVTELEPIALEAVAERAWQGVDTDDAVLSLEGSATVLADRDRLLRLFENLFRNAVEHGSTNSRPGADDAGRRDASSEPSVANAPDDSVEHTSTDPDGTERPPTVSVGVIGTEPIDGFYVADEGRGLPADPERVFEEGYTTDESGTGLGLSIVESIATAHGWTVDAGESAAGGARFEFTGVEIPASDDRVPSSR